MQKKYGYLGKNIVLLLMNGFVPKLFAFLMVPLCAHNLTSYEYGVADLVITTVQMIMPVFTLDIQDAVIRFTLDIQYAKEDVFSVAMKIIFEGSILLCILEIIFMIWMPNIKIGYFFYIWLLFDINALYNSCSMFCRGTEKINILVGASTVNSFIQLLAGIVLIYILRTGLYGYLFSLFAGKFVGVLFMLFVGKIYRYIKLERVTVQTKAEMKKFSIPLIFSVIAWWINSAADRYIVSWMKGIAISGIYSMSYTIPNVLAVFQNIFAQAWSISAIKDFDSEDSDGFIGQVYEFMNGGMVIVCSLLMIMNKGISNILFSPEFFNAWIYVPPLLISVVFNAMALFIGSLFTAVKDTKTLAASTVIGAVVNLVGNIILVYFIGAYGAAISTILGYGIVFLLRQKALSRYMKMKIYMKRNILSYILLVVQMVIAYFSKYFLVLQIIILMLIIALYIEVIKKMVKRCI